MEQLTATMAERAGVRGGAPFDRAIEAVRAAPEAELEPLVEQLRRGVADLERVVEGAAPVTAADDPPGITVL